LNGQAPAGGVSVSLTSANPAVATVPATVVVPQRSSTVSFPITTFAVSSTSLSKITAAANGGSANATITVQPNVSFSVALNPPSVVGGSANSTFTITLATGAPAGGLKFIIASSNTAAAKPASTPVTITAGHTTGTVTINTFAVASTQTANISATLGTTSQSAPLMVTP
ncbi:MAG TPA: hypothetical protein VGS41_06840, partial [Chthonomonadales bacterium]|nr:hypothetical protein [Chthonomonadales bacterium]